MLLLHSVTLKLLLETTVYYFCCIIAIIMKLPTSVSLSVLSLVACVRASFDATCTDVEITSTGVITAHCDDGSGGSNDTSLDLKNCYTYYDGELIVSLPIHTLSYSSRGCR